MNLYIPDAETGPARMTTQGLQSQWYTCLWANISPHKMDTGIRLAGQQAQFCLDPGMKSRSGENSFVSDRLLRQSGQEYLLLFCDSVNDVQRDI